jgi:hypothetical protein
MSQAKIEDTTTERFICQLWQDRLELTHQRIPEDEDARSTARWEEVTRVEWRIIGTPSRAPSEMMMKVALLRDFMIHGESLDGVVLALLGSLEADLRALEMERAFGPRRDRDSERLARERHSGHGDQMKAASSRTTPLPTLADIGLTTGVGSPRRA